jgi:hypothetical protein
MTIRIIRQIPTTPLLCANPKKLPMLSGLFPKLYPRCPNTIATGNTNNMQMPTKISDHFKYTCGISQCLGNDPNSGLKPYTVFGELIAIAPTLNLKVNIILYRKSCNVKNKTLLG